MGKRIIYLDPAILRSLVDQDMTWHLHVCVGVPDDATFVHAWCFPPTEKLALVFESPAWPETPEGEPYPVIDAVVASVGWHETEAEFRADQDPMLPMGKVNCHTNQEYEQIVGTTVVGHG